MIKEILMFLLLFLHSKAENVNDSISFAWACKTEGGELLDRWDRICIPSDNLGKLIFNPATRDDSKTEIDVKVSKLQIIKIGYGTITLSMNMEMMWFEDRVKINTYGFHLQKIPLRQEDQEQIWSPQIAIKNDMVSISMERETIGLWGGEDRISCLAAKNFYLSTKVKCEMDFQTFPFDKHVCKIEVMIKQACSPSSQFNAYFFHFSV